MSNHIVASVDPESCRVEARTDSGHSISMELDAPDGPSPVEALLASLAGCTGMDVASILKKKRQAAATYEIAIDGDRTEEHPRIFTAIRVEHRVSGNVEPEALRRSIELSATAYCPVSAMLSAVARVEHRYRLVDGDGREHEAVVAVLGPGDRRPTA
jgi:putative redox protein